MPDWRRLIRQRLADVPLPPADEIGIVEELAQHVEDCYQDLCARGLPPCEAEALSLQEIDGTQLAEEFRESLPRE